MLGVIRNEIKEKLSALIDYYELEKEDIANIRRQDKIDQVTANVILDYYQFVCNYATPNDVENLRHDLVDFIKAFESLRGNSIIDYVPRYEKFLRHYGY